VVAQIFVLAGVNGAGKSSIGGAALESRGVGYFNPDLAARSMRNANPTIPVEQANAQAWKLGRRGLERALAEGGNFACETTLGGKTIPDILLKGARGGAWVHVWFAGLSSPELHIARVRNRVAAGGHDIPEAKIRERYTGSIVNLIRLLPHLRSLRVYDNSSERDPMAGNAPEPLLLLQMESGKVVSHQPLARIPDWAKPVLAAALRAPANRSS
jgi:predicted ABC-type ATPase